MQFVDVLTIVVEGLHRVEGCGGSWSKKTLSCKFEGTIKNSLKNKHNPICVKNHECKGGRKNTAAVTSPSSPEGSELERGENTAQ